MTRGARYGLFALIFGLVLIGLLTKSSTVALLAVPVAVIYGLFVEKIDNKRDEKFKAYNKIHPHFPK